MLEHPGDHLHSGIDAHERSDRRITLQDARRRPTGTAARPGFGTVLADQMSIAHYKDGRWSAAQMHADRADRDASRGARASLREHVLRGLQGLSLARRQRARLPHGSHIERMRQSARLLTMPEPDAEQLAAMVIVGHRSLPRPGARAAGRALPAAAALRHDAEHRRGVDADQRGEPDRAREPGLGLLLGRHEAAADLRRGQGQPHGLAPRGWSRPAATTRPRWARRSRRATSTTSTRCSSARAARCRRPARRTSC